MPPRRRIDPSVGEESVKRWFVGGRQREEILQMHKRGASVKEIAKRTGRSEGTISTVIYREYRGKSIAHDEQIRRCVVYPGLRDWFLGAGASINEASRVCGASPETMSNWLGGGARGRMSEPMPKWCIDRMLAWTGLTYEQAFAKRRETDE